MRMTSIHNIQGVTFEMWTLVSTSIDWEQAWDSIYDSTVRIEVARNLILQAMEGLIEDDQ